MPSTNATGTVVQLDHPLVVTAVAEMRHKDTPTPRFRNRVRELAKFLIYEATRDLETDIVDVPTPLEVTQGASFGDRPIRAPRSGVPGSGTVRRARRSRRPHRGGEVRLP